MMTMPRNAGAHAYVFLLFTLRLVEISAVLLGCLDKTLEAIPQQQPLAIILRLRNEGQQHVSQIGADFLNIQLSRQLYPTR